MAFSSIDPATRNLYSPRKRNHRSSKGGASVELPRPRNQMQNQSSSLYSAAKSRILREVERIWVTVSLTLLALPAHAQASDPVSRLLTKAVDLLTNRWAVASAVVTIAVMGYRMKYGMMDKRNAFVTIFGIVIVFGAALLVEEIRGELWSEKTDCTKR